MDLFISRHEALGTGVQAARHWRSNYSYDTIGSQYHLVRPTQSQTAVAAHLKSEQLLLFVFAGRYGVRHFKTKQCQVGAFAYLRIRMCTA